MEAVIEQGLVMLIQSGLGSPPLCQGGFLDTLPENFISASQQFGYMCRIISDSADHGLTHSVGQEKIRYEVNCYSYTGAGVLQLAKLIDQVLQGFAGVLPDPDSTTVYCSMRSDRMDFPYDPNARNYRRMLEYEISFNNTF